ncbi:unnamed protein product [Prunus armeniaca]
MYKSSVEYMRSVWIMKWSRKGRAAEGGREEEAHAFVTEALATEDRLEGVNMGERILRASVEGDTKRLNVLLLVVIKDAFGKGSSSWLCL